MKSYTHYKLIDSRSGTPMGFTYKVETNTEVDPVKLDLILNRASLKKNCPVDMIEVVEYRPWKRRK